MKKLAVVVGLVFSATLAYSAEEPKVEITSFIFAGQRTRAAELCGKVTGSNAPFLAVKVTVDPNTDKPGIYNTLVGKEGGFCVTVVSYGGTAEASAWLLGRELSSGIVPVRKALEH